MSALIPALIKLLMSRRGGGGGGGSGGGREPMSDAEKDKKYWNRELLDMQNDQQAQRESDARSRARASRPLPSL